MRLAVFVAVLCSSSLFLAGCNTVETTSIEPIAVPAQWQTLTNLAASQTTPWIKDFDSPVLEQLLNEALLNNQNLKVSAARVVAANAAARIAGADLYPEVTGTIDGGRRRSNSDNNDSNNDNRNDARRNYNSEIGVGIDVSWEADLWGRLSSRADAAILDIAVTEAEWQAAKLSIAANVAKSWFNLLETQLQLALVEQRLLNLSDNLITIEDDFRLGLRDALDVYLAKADVAGEQARKARSTTALFAARRTLEVLLGRYPKGLVENSDQLIPLTSDIPSGLPSELLKRRPDLIASQKQLASANERAAAAHADRFPRLSLTGSAGTRSDEMNNLFSSDYFVWSVLSGLSAPLFDAGRLEAFEEQERANVTIAEATYNQALLNAFQEVEAGLINEQLLMAQERALKEAVEESVAAETLAFEQYQSGLIDFITVLESQRRSFDAQSTEIETRNLRLQNRINLYLALGGAFMDEYPPESQTTK